MMKLAKHLLFLIVILWAVAALAETRLTTTQLATLRADILADPALTAWPNNPDGNIEIAKAYNLTASPDFWVWRTAVQQREIVGSVSPDGTSWNWTDFINRTAAERDGWRVMFNDEHVINYSLLNVRQGLADIFSGVSGANQRAHLTAMGRRKALRIEKLFAAGTGSTASPATMVIEGTITYLDVEEARR